MPTLSPPISFQAFNDDGSFMVGGLLYTYAAGTSTPKVTYSDYLLASPNTNPVVLDARGEATLFLDGNYKYVLHDADDVLVREQDNVRDFTSSATLTNATLSGTLTVTSTAVTWSGNPTHSGNHTFTNNVVVNGNTTLGDSSADTLTIAPNAVTWSAATITHSGDHIFSEDVTLGNAAADTATINATTTFPLALTTHTFGASFGNVARSGLATLDWYEEDDGTDTVTVAGTSTAGTATYAAQAIRWTRIGNRVFFDITVIWSSFTGTGNMLVKGLPYPPDATVTACYVEAENLTFSNQIAAEVQSLNSGQIAITQVSSGAALGAVAVDAAGSLFISGSYRVV